MSQPFFDVIGLTELNNDPLFREIDGQFVSGNERQLRVAVIDTGLDASHPLFEDRVVEFVDFVDGGNGTGNAFDPNGHGTHAAGIVAADNLGVAPEADLIGLRALGENQDGDEVLQALQWVLDNRSALNIVAVNLSLGVPAAFFSDPDNLDNDFAIAVSEAIADLEAAGITVISAAGNDYVANDPDQNLSTPAISSTLAVGAVWQDSTNANRVWNGGSLDTTTGADRLTSFSQRLDAPNFLLAPGAIIESTFPGDRLAGLAGTSQAAPVVAGAVTLLQDAALTFGGRLLTPDEVRDILISTADEVFDGDDEDTNVDATDATFSRLNIYSAVQEVERRFAPGATLETATAGTVATFAAASPGSFVDMSALLAAAVPQFAAASASDITVGIAETTTPDPRDPNGTTGGALFIDFNTGFQQFFDDNIGNDGTFVVGASDVDLFQFEVEVPSIFAAVTGGPTGTDTVLTLFDATGGVIVSNDQDSLGTNFSELGTLLQPGTYFVGVSGFDNLTYDPNSIDTIQRLGFTGSQGDYNLGVSLLADGADLRDPNGTIPGAEAIDFAGTSQQVVTENIGNDGTATIGASDVDLFRFEIDVTADFTAATSGPTGTDTILALFAADGTNITFNDQAGDGTNFSEITATDLEPGTYFVGVSGFNNQGYDPNDIDAVVRGGFEASQGDYTLTLNLTDAIAPPPVTGEDLNGITASAIDVDFTGNSFQLFLESIGSDFTNDGSVAPVGPSDVDLFRFEVEAEIATLLALTTPGVGPISADTVLSLFDADGTFIASNDPDGAFGTAASETTLVQTIDAGTYFLGVSGFDNLGYDPTNIAGAPRIGLPESQGDYGLGLLLAENGDLDSITLGATGLGAALGTGNDSVNALLSPTTVTTGIVGDDFGISIESDVDLIRFEVGDEGGLVTIETQPDPNNPDLLDSILRLFDADGNQIAIDDDGGQGLYSSITASLEPGVYFAGVSGFSNSNYNPLVSGSGISGSTGGYQTVFQFEPGFSGSGDLTGTFGTALSLGDLGDSNIGFPLTTVIGGDPLFDSQGTLLLDNLSVGPTDVDLFSFEVPDAGILVLETNDFTSLALLDEDGNGRIDERNEFGGIPDTGLRVFNAQGNEIAFDDDSGDGLFSQVIAEIPEAGTYFIGVSSFPNFNYDPTVANVASDSANRVEGSVGVTNLDVLFFQLGSDAGVDLDGTRLGANPIIVNPGGETTLMGTLGQDDLFAADDPFQVDDADVDLYEFVADFDGTLLIDIDTPPDGGPIADTFLRFFDAAGNDITPLVDNNGDGIDDRDIGAAENFAGNLIEFDTNNIAIDSSEVVDEFGNVVGHDTDSFIRVDVEAGTTYFIGVSGFGNGNYSIDSFENRSAASTGGNYTLNIAYGGASAASDLDGAIDTEAPPISLAPGQPFQVDDGNIGEDNGQAVGFADVDFYPVSPTQTGILNINIDAFGLPGGGSLVDPVDSTIFVFDANGNELAFNDDTDAFTNLGFLDSALQLPVQAGQELFVAVTGYGNFGFDPDIAGSGPGGSTGNYNLSIDLTATDPSLLGGGDDRIILDEFITTLSTSPDPTAAVLDLDLNVFEVFNDQGNIDLPPGVTTTEIGDDESAFISGNLGEDGSFEVEDDEPAPGPPPGALPELPDRSHPGGPIYASLSGIQNNVTVPVIGGDVDLFPLTILDAGTYDLNAENTIANNPQLLEFGAQTTLLLFDAQAELVEDLSADSDRVLANLVPGDYVLVVLPEGTEDSFDILDQSFDPPAELQDLIEQNSGSYQLFLQAFELQNNNSPEADTGAFSLQLNNTPDLGPLRLYDGLDAETGGPSVVVTDPQGNDVPGSLVLEETAGGSTQVTFIPAAPLPSNGPFTVTYSSSDFVTSGEVLNGGTDLDGTVSFAEADEAAPTAVAFAPSFARGPGQSANFPINLNGGSGVSAIDLTLEYNPTLLDISDVLLADSLAADGWQIAFEIDAANGQVTVELTSGPNALQSDAIALIELVATTPLDAPLNATQILEVSAGARMGQLAAGTSQAVAIAPTSAVHAVTDFGDANGDGSVDFGDALALANLALIDEVDGFDFGPLDLLDPAIIGDLDGNDSIDLVDAQAAAAEFLNDSPFVPAIAAGTVAASVGADSGLALTVAPPQDGGTEAIATLSLAEDLDTPEGVGNFQVVIQYPPAQLNIAPEDVQLSQELLDLGYAIEGGVEIDPQAGEIRFGTLPLTGNFIAAGADPELATLNFTLQPGATLEPEAVSLEAGTNIFSPAAVALAAGSMPPQDVLDLDGAGGVDPFVDVLNLFRVLAGAPQAVVVTAAAADSGISQQDIVNAANTVMEDFSEVLDLDGAGGVDPFVDVLNLFRVLAGAPQAVVVTAAAADSGISQQDIVNAAGEI